MTGPTLTQWQKDQAARLAACYPVIPLKTGWPEPALAQDDNRKLFGWFASRPDARRCVREACEEIKTFKVIESQANADAMAIVRGEMK